MSETSTIRGPGGRGVESADGHICQFQFCTRKIFGKCAEQYRGEIHVSKSYFQFPLCALNLPEAEKSRLNRIIEFGCVEVGKHMWARLSEREREHLRSYPPIPLETNHPATRDSYIRALLGAQRVSVTLGSISATVEGHRVLLRHLSAFEQRFGRDVLVRLATAFVFDARDGRGLSYLELAVLAAIYSKIGAADRPVRITREEIWRRAHGYKSKNAFLNIDRLPWFSARKTRSVIERLRERGFFAHVTYGRRQTYYSHRLSLDELINAVAKEKIHRTVVRHRQIQANCDLTNRIRTERHKLLVNCTATKHEVPLVLPALPPLK